MCVCCCCVSLVSSLFARFCDDYYVCVSLCFVLFFFFFANIKKPGLLENRITTGTERIVQRYEAVDSGMICLVIRKCLQCVVCMVISSFFVFEKIDPITRLLVFSSPFRLETNGLLLYIDFLLFLVLRKNLCVVVLSHCELIIQKKCILYI